MKRAILGDVEFSVVEQDDISISAEITDKSVESGQDVSDHVKPKPDILSIKGIIVGPDASKKWETLKQYNRTGELLTYINRVIYGNMAIQDFHPVHGKDIANGYKFSMTLKQVRIAEPREIVITNIPPKVQTKTKEVQKAGRKQPQEKKTDKKRILLAKLRTEIDARG